MELADRAAQSGDSCVGDCETQLEDTLVEVFQSDSLVRACGTIVGELSLFHELPRNFRNCRNFGFPNLENVHEMSPKYNNSPVGTDRNYAGEGRIQSGLQGCGGEHNQTNWPK